MISLWLRPGASPLRPWRRAIWKQKKALIGFLGALGSFFLFSFLAGAAGAGGAATTAAWEAGTAFFFGAAACAATGATSIRVIWLVDYQENMMSSLYNFHIVKERDSLFHYIEVALKASSH